MMRALSYVPLGWGGSGQKKLGCLLALAATPLQAEQFDCVMQDSTEIRFAIDPAQFVDAVHPGEPIQRKVTQVEMGTSRFPAEPFRIGALRGFSAEDIGGGTLIFVVNPDGSARISSARAGHTETGTCEVYQ